MEVSNPKHNSTKQMSSGFWQISVSLQLNVAHQASPEGKEYVLVKMTQNTIATRNQLNVRKAFASESIRQAWYKRALAIDIQR